MKISEMNGKILGSALVLSLHFLSTNTRRGEKTT
jgi:hypothetical protein